MARRAPRPTRKPPLTAWGQFLQDERVKAGRTQRETFDHFRGKYPDAFDWSDDSVTAYGNLERGPGEPNESQKAAFLREYGHNELPLDVREADDPEPTLAAALVALTDELRASRLAREETEIRYRMLDAEVRSLRAQLNAAESPVQSAPPETAGSAG